MGNNEDEFIEFSRQLLDDSLDNLDDSVLSRLRQSRQLAINAAMQSTKQSKQTEPDSENNFLFPNWLVPASTGAAFATIALSVTLFWTQAPFQQTPQQYQENSFIEDINLLSQSEDLDLYQNLEFYLWLEDEKTS